MIKNGSFSPDFLSERVVSCLDDFGSSSSVVSLPGEERGSIGTQWPLSLETVLLVAMMGSSHQSATMRSKLLLRRLFTSPVARVGDDVCAYLIGLSSERHSYY